MLKEVQEYEKEQGGVVLDPSAVRDSFTYFPAWNPHTIPQTYAHMLKNKSILVIRMLELRIGLELLLQVRLIHMMYYSPIDVVLVISE